MNDATGRSSDFAGHHLSRLRAVIEGAVITPADPGYDDARAVFLGDVDIRPAVIVRVAGVDDVCRVVALAGETGLELAVRGGGHSAAGYGLSEGGIVLDVRSLDALEFDADGRAAWAGSGLAAGVFTKEAAERGLAVGFGDTASVGLGGITLGGGVGYLSRAFGLTIDSLLAAEIVTADGRIRHVDAETEPDLFWAIRGGGGNLGVVTRFRYRLVDLPSVYGGMLILPATPETVAGFVAAADAAPDALSTIANVMPCPPMPFVPAEHHGRTVILATMVYAGDAVGGERAVAPLRDLAAPIVDQVRPMRYPEIYPPEDPSYRPRAVVRNLYVDRIGEDEARTIVERVEASDAAMRVVQLRVLGGAVDRVPVDATAYAHRGRRIMVQLAAFYGDEAERVARREWEKDLAAAITNGPPAAYANFLGDEGEARVREAYPGRTWDRLAEIKRRYDPTNLFHRNQNVPPA